jgi:hypothetical protein
MRLQIRSRRRRRAGGFGGVGSRWLDESRLSAPCGLCATRPARSPARPREANSVSRSAVQPSEDRSVSSASSVMVPCLPSRRIGRRAVTHHRCTPRSFPTVVLPGLLCSDRARFDGGQPASRLLALPRPGSLGWTNEGLTGSPTEPLHSLGEVPPVAGGEVERVAQGSPLLVIRDHDLRADFASFLHLVAKAPQGQVRHPHEHVQSRSLAARQRVPLAMQHEYDIHPSGTLHPAIQPDAPVMHAACCFGSYVTSAAHGASGGRINPAAARSAAGEYDR